ncbi:WD40/YVTN/BNR-like repeat-containing protein [Streptomyces sp. NPDC015130]|uniref:WD40/YVTN/BNR-like repeat-containing protein n=1 Tax=Streptomyces sp. NPDC015130 TaxID=3364940 RepID=UPI0036F5E2D6
MRGNPQDTAVVKGERQGIPGGKALARLMLELARTGHADAAVEAALHARPDMDEEAAQALLESVAGRPPDGHDDDGGGDDDGGDGGDGDAGGAGPGEGGTQSAKPPSAGGADPGEEMEQVAANYMAVAERLSMTQPSPTGPNWRSLGPWTIPNGQTYGAARINASGRVSSVAVDPGNASHLLAGAAHGGIWESYNRGQSWAPRTDHAATLTTGAIAFHPTAPATVLAGTGEGDWWRGFGTGILRSTNGGSTWTSLVTAPFVGQGFHDLEFDRATPTRVYAATTGGLYVSNDTGATWTQRRTAWTWSVAVAPSGAEAFAACRDGLFRSTDGGTTWNAVTLPGTPPATWSRLAVAIAPSDPTVAYVFGAGASPYLARRAAGTWTAIGAPTGVSILQAWYDWFLAVSPDNAGQIYCGAISAHRGDLSGTTWTWTDIASRPSPGQSIHPDQHAIAFEPGQPQVVYIGNDGGLYRSPDRGVTWQHLNNGLEITEFEYLAQDLGSSRWLMGGTQDNGTERWTGSPSWLHSQDGDGGDCGVNRTDPRTVFHSFYNMGVERSTSRGDWGSWAWLPPPVVAGEQSLFYPPFESSATNGNTVAQAGGALYVSRDNCTNWTRLGFPTADTASAMYIPTADQVYVGTIAGRLYVTRWNGTAWGALTALTTPRANAWISDIHVDPTDTNRVWVTHTTRDGGRVWRSTDGGTTWADRTAALPNLPLNAVEVHPGNRDRVWVAADLGVYQTLDGGASWQMFSNGLPNAFVGDLLYQRHARVLRAGLRNRGVWEIPVDGWMTQPVCGVQWTGTVAANSTRRFFTWGWPATWHVLWTVMPTTIRPGAEELTWKVQVERGDAEYVTYWVSVTNLTPVPVAFEGRFAILSRY